jgi:predicted DNA-binding transcriptional regulator AlpA
MDHQPKAAITVSEMCSLLGMSRTQFYEHVRRGTFHEPKRLANGRPFFIAAQVEDNLRAKELGIGVNGEYVLFYNRTTRIADTSNQAHAVRPTAKIDHSDLLSGLRQLGLNPTAQQVDDAVSVVYPKGIAGIDETDVLRAIFRHLKRSGAA